MDLRLTLCFGDTHPALVKCSNEPDKQCNIYAGLMDFQNKETIKQECQYNKGKYIHAVHLNYKAFIVSRIREFHFGQF